MTDLPDDQGWKEHLERHEKTTDKPACPYCANQGIQFSTGTLHAHTYAEHYGMEIMLTTFNQNHPLPCIFHLILGCNVSFPEQEGDAWRSHNLSHFGSKGPPNYTACIFCDAKFREYDPYTCWELFFTHASGHLLNGYKIDNSKPTFKVLMYMYNNNWISKEDYDHCMAYTERPFSEGLRPLDYIPAEIITKAEIAAEKGNRIVVDDRRERREIQPILKKQRRQPSNLPPKIEQQSSD